MTQDNSGCRQRGKERRTEREKEGDGREGERERRMEREREYCVVLERTMPMYE